MNKILWKILGILCGILCVIAGKNVLTTMFEVLPSFAPEDRLDFLLLYSVFIVICFLSAILCFFPRSQGIALRILGVYGVAAGILIIFEALRTHNYSKIGIMLLYWLLGSIHLIRYGKITDSENNSDY